MRDVPLVSVSPPVAAVFLKSEHVPESHNVVDLTASPRTVRSTKTDCPNHDFRCLACYLILGEFDNSGL